MEGIYGQQCIPHISIMKFKVSFEGEELRLTWTEEKFNRDEALAILVNSPNVVVSQSDELAPCFDLNEMQQRNKRRVTCS